MDEQKLMMLVGAVENLIDTNKNSINTAVNELRTENNRLKSIKDDVSTTVRDLKDVAKSGVYSIDKRHESYDEQQKKLFNLKQLCVICSFIIAVAIIAVISIHFYASSIKSDIDKAKRELVTITEQKIAVQNEINELWNGRTFSMQLGLKAGEKNGYKGVIVPNFLHSIKMNDGSTFFYQ